MRINEQSILGINGADFSISVGIVDKGKPKGMIFLNDGSPGSETLLSAIDQLLKMLHLEKEALDGICVTLGPGSFTSLRVSLSIAEAMGLALDIPTYGVNNLQLIAATVPFFPGRIKVIQNAYKGELYTAAYSTANGAISALDELRLITPEDFLKSLKPDELVLGNAVADLLKRNMLQADKHKWNAAFHRQVSAVSIIEFFLEQEVKPPSKIPLEPIYIRLSDAELNYSRQFRHR